MTKKTYGQYGSIDDPRHATVHYHMGLEKYRVRLYKNGEHQLLYDTNDINDAHTKAQKWMIN